MKPFKGDIGNSCYGQGENLSPAVDCCEYAPSTGASATLRPERILGTHHFTLARFAGTYGEGRALDPKYSHLEMGDARQIALAIRAQGFDLIGCKPGEVNVPRQRLWNFQDAISPAGRDDQSRNDLDFVAGAGIDLKAEATPYWNRTPVIVMRRRTGLLRAGNCVDRVSAPANKREICAAFLSVLPASAEFRK